jgi:glycerate-2-kinase
MANSPTSSDEKLRADAIAIWQAGVDAVRSEKLVLQAIQLEGDCLQVCDHRFSVAGLNRIAVVGAGKAGAGMALAVEQALGEDVLRDKVTGWVNVPADCVRPTQKVHLHAARPAGVNEPTQEGVEGARKIYEIVQSLTSDDLCLVLVSGGGSALLPAPQPPITLEDKHAVTRFLMHSGATIQELNAVRKRLSQLKGGGLARASRAGMTIALIISDIVGDPLDMIASGPTFPDPTTDAEALAVLRKFEAGPPAVPQRILDFLAEAAETTNRTPPFPDNVANHIIGSNATAMEAAAEKARQLGYHVISHGSQNCGEANDEGRALAGKCQALRDGELPGELPACILSGGEPVVRLAKTDKPRLGGRNQQLVLAALESLRSDGMNRIVILSGGTDGEDGPTDAAGAWADAPLVRHIESVRIDPRPYLEINDSYGFFDKTKTLLHTGPTHTNVMDLRVALVGA